MYVYSRNETSLNFKTSNMEQNEHITQSIPQIIFLNGFVRRFKILYNAQNWILKIFVITLLHCWSLVITLIQTSLYTCNHRKINA